ncbi:Protein EFR3 [Debaryomyces fabryi]|uniref:Protein EFR3 n=1 Tax=Debaryomyces fabryi TaxID=58627 RepID=A0A0V1Q5L9_9ASCO|nr:Protein EFR3 [Debaryomyces fabryi]KSA03803.1 Protein EFR3 [Debaryomyces fabryi]CUM45323.1 unnamed protein product [Debaryomyces fabryi]
MPIFRPKHQKLILQCYPPGKGVDKKPNPSELSYLLYYASTRRVKLEKVVTFLDRKTTSDVKHNRAGNLQVTLTIISSLIEECSENLNVFASFVCSILKSVLQSKDLSLCKHAIQTYGVLCSKLDGGLFSGDKEFVDSFGSLSQSLINIGKENLKKQGPNNLEWQMISLMTCRYLSNCLGYNNKFSKKFIEICIPILTDTVHANNKQSNLLAILKSNVNIEDESHHLGRISLTKTNQTNRKVQQDLDNDAVQESNLNEEALRGLKSLFSTSLTSQISEATRAIVKNNYATTIDPVWGCTFLEMCTTWIPVQLRFITLSTVLSSLTSLSNKSTKQSSNYAIQLSYANYCLGLVSSDVNMIGLSISDVIQQILYLQANLLLSQSHYFQEDDVKKLSMIYSNCVCNLSTHIYYFDQVPDSIREILIKIVSVLENSVISGKTDTDGVYRFIITLLEDISIIFDLLKKKPSNISRNHVNLEDWDLSLILLSSEMGLDPNKDQKSLFSYEQVTYIQFKYLLVFEYFLNNELVAKDENMETGAINSIESFNVGGDYLQPDYSNYISDPGNFISHFLSYVDKFFSGNSMVDVNNARILEKLLKDMISILGINFINNFVPFFFYWQLPLNPNLVDENTRVKDTLGYTIIYHCLIKMDEIYELNYVKDTEFFNSLLGDINYRKLNKLWINGLQSEEEDAVLDNHHALGHRDESGTLKFNPTRKNLEDFVIGNAFTLSWINPHRALILDVINDNLPKKANNQNLLSESSDEPSIVEELSYHTSARQNGFGLGLGNANDISSIHSGLLFNQNHNINMKNVFSNGNETSNGSVYTSDRQYNTPRVSDLKDSILMKKKPGVVFNENYNSDTTPGSVLSKQMVTSDIDSILGGLDIDDDPEIIV